MPFVQVASTFERIGALYAVEADVRGQPPDVRLNARQARAAPLIADLRTAFNDAFRRLSAKSVMAKAIVYGTKRWTALTCFLDDGRLEIDNNIAKIAADWSASRWDEFMPWNWQPATAEPLAQVA